jgi:DUF1365 family protein
VRILATDREGPLLAATFRGRRRVLTTSTLLRSLFALPLVSFKIVAAIHWEALRLWLKGVRLVPRANAAPKTAIPAAVQSGSASGECDGYDGSASAAGVFRSRESAVVR